MNNATALLKANQLVTDCWEDIEDLSPESQHTIEYSIAVALMNTWNDAIAAASTKLINATDHQIKVDKDPAWDPTRFEEEGPCEDHGIGHSYPGYAGHVLAQMADVIDGLKVLS